MFSVDWAAENRVLSLILKFKETYLLESNDIFCLSGSCSQRYEQSLTTCCYARASH